LAHSIPNPFDKVYSQSRVVCSRENEQAHACCASLFAQLRDSKFAPSETEGADGREEKLPLVLIVKKKLE
jgi:hypothetical protein